MKCSDKNIRNLIFDYVDSNLDENNQKEVELHLIDCQDCRNLEKEYRGTISGIRSFFKESAQAHIPPETLVDYVDNLDELNKSQREAVELHLDLCGTCYKKVEMLKQVASTSVITDKRTIIDRFLEIVRNFFTQLTAKPAVVIATTVIILLIAVPMGYLINSHLTGKPQIQFTQAKKVTWLREAQRTAYEKPVVLEKDGWIEIGLMFDTFFDEENYILELEKSDEILLHRVLSESDVSTGSELFIRLKTKNLDQGEYQLVIISFISTSRQELSRAFYPFVLKKE